jgi:hypothetical protein
MAASEIHSSTKLESIVAGLKKAWVLGLGLGRERAGALLIVLDGVYGGGVDAQLISKPENITNAKVLVFIDQPLLVCAVMD